MKPILMKDIAKATGFSINTVSRALRDDSKLSEQTRKLICDKADELGYINNSLASSMRLKHSKIIGVITADSSNPFFADVVRGIEATAKNYNYNILLVNTGESPDEEKQYLKLFCGRHVDGLLIVPVFDDESIQKLYSRIDIPYLFLGRVVKGNENHSILHSDYSSQKEIVNYLINKGHKKILYLSGPDNVSNTYQRLNAYKDTLIENNIDVDSQYIIPTSGHIEDGYAAVNTAINQGIKFTAICCFNDLVAMGVLKSLKENNFDVPNEIEVFGFDNLKISQFMQPSISTVDVPKFALGCEAVHILMAHIEDANLEYTTKNLKTRLIFRESSPREIEVMSNN
jgi:LacI family transcriptional regulator